MLCLVVNYYGVGIGFHWDETIVNEWKIGLNRRKSLGECLLLKVTSLPEKKRVR